MSDTPYDARQVANWFIERFSKEERKISIMTLLKLAYISYGWYFAMVKRRLFHNRIEAWKYGPVIPDIYNGYQSKGVYVEKKNHDVESLEDKQVIDFLERVYDVYGDMSAFQLSNITHEAGGPWEAATKLGGFYAEIPDILIKAHYVDKVREATGT